MSRRSRCKGRRDAVRNTDGTGQERILATSDIVCRMLRVTNSRHTDRCREHLLPPPFLMPWAYVHCMQKNGTRWMLQRKWNVWYAIGTLQLHEHCWLRAVWWGGFRADIAKGWSWCLYWRKPPEHWGRKFGSPLGREFLSWQRLRELGVVEWLADWYGICKKNSNYCL
jgi:hypothetical protein